MRINATTLPRNFIRSSLVATTFVLAIAPSAGAVSVSLSAQSALDQFKSTVTSAIDSSISKLQDSANSLNTTINLSASSTGVSGSVTSGGNTASGSVSSSGASGSVSTSNGSTASGSVSSSGASSSVSTSTGSASSGISSDGTNSAITFSPGSLLESLLSVPKELKQKLQQSNQQAIQQLQTLKTQVAATTDMTDLQAQAKQFDQEFKEIAQANVQAAVTKSIDSATQVLDQLGVAANNLQTQVNALKQCIESGSASATGSVSGGSASGSASVTAPDCSDLNVATNSGDNGQSLQDQIDQIKSSLQTIRSFLSSSIDLVSQLKDGNYTGTIQSFSGIDSQLDITASLSADVQNDLLNLSAAVNK